MSEQRNSLTRKILIAIAFGIGIGCALFYLPDLGFVNSFLQDGVFYIGGQIFYRQS